MKCELTTESEFCAGHRCNTGFILWQDIPVRGDRFSTLFVNFESRRGDKDRRRQEREEEEERVEEGRRRGGGEGRGGGGEGERRYLCGEERLGKRYVEKSKELEGQRNKIKGEGESKRRREEARKGVKEERRR